MGLILWFVSCQGTEAPIVEPVARYGVPTAALLKTHRAGELPPDAIARLGESRWGPRWPDAPQSTATTTQPQRRARAESPDPSRPQNPARGEGRSWGRDRGDSGRPRSERESQPRVVALEGGRWATRSDDWWTLWDPALGAIAEAEGSGLPTPDGAWIVGEDTQARLDPTPLEGIRSARALWWGEDFAIQLQLAATSTLAEPPFRAEPSPERPGGWFDRGHPAGLSVVHGDGEELLLGGCLTPEALWCAADRRCACQTDDGLVAFANEGSPLGIWDPEERGLSPSTVLFIPGRNTLVLGGRQGQVALWTPHTGEHQLLDLARDFGTPDLAISSDGSLLLAARSDGAIALVDTRDGQRIDAPGGARPSVVAVAVDPEGQLAALDAWGAVRQWDPGLKPTGQLRSVGTDKSELRVRSGGICAVGSSTSTCWTTEGQPDDTPFSRGWTLVHQGADPHLRAPGGALLALPGLRGTAPLSVAHAPDDRWLLVEASNRVLVDAEAKKASALPGERRGPAAVDAQGRVWIAEHPHLSVLDPAGLRLGQVPLVRHATALAVDDQIVVAGHPDGTLTVWDVAAFELDTPHPRPQRPATAPPGAEADLDLSVRTPRTRRLRKGAQLRRSGDTLVLIHEGERHPLEALPADGLSVVSIDGSRVAAASGGQLWMWYADGALRQLQPGEVHQLSIAANGRWLAALVDRGVALIDLDHGEVHRFLPTSAEGSPGASLRFSEDSTALQLQGGWRWSVPDGILEQHPLRGPITALAASDDGAWIAAATRQGDVVIVDRTSGEVRARHEGLGQPRALSFVGSGDQLWLGDATGGSALITVGQPLQRRGSWPWSRIEGLRVQPDGVVGVYDGARWWSLDPSDPNTTLHADPTSLRPSWLEALDTEAPLRFSGPGVDAPVPHPDAPCAQIVSARCDPALPAAPPPATGLSELLPSPTGTAFLGSRDGSWTLRGASDRDLQLPGASPDGRYTWLSPDRILGVLPDQLLTWEGAESPESYPLPVLGETHRIAAASDRVVRRLDTIVLAQSLDGQPECVLPAGGPAGPLAISSDGALAAWGPIPTIADLESCGIVPLSSTGEAPPPEAQAVLHQGVGWRFGEALRTGHRPGWIHREDSAGHPIARATGAAGALTALDPTGTIALIGDQVWSIEPLQLLRTLPSAPSSAAVSPQGHIAWLEQAQLWLDLQGDPKQIPLGEEVHPEAVAFTPSGALLLATSGPRIQVLRIETLLERAEQEPEP